MPDFPRGKAYKRLLAFYSLRNAHIRPREADAAAPAPARVRRFALRADMTAESPTVPPETRRALVADYRSRIRQTAAPRPEAPAFRGVAPAPAPANNWIPIGPSVLRKGQAANRPAVSGRVPGI